MKKKNRSEVSLSIVRSETQYKEEVYVPPLDVISIKISDLRIPDEDPKPYAVVVSFFDQLLISRVLTTTGGREVKEDRMKTIARGNMNYDPSDYEKMCLFADNPLIIKIHPLRSVDTNSGGVLNSSVHSPSTKSTKSSSLAFFKPDAETYYCNIDILPIFIELNKIHFKKRLEPFIKPSVLSAKSWANLPMITLTLKAIRNPANESHHKMLKNANYMKMTLVGSYNMIVPFDDQNVYTAASKLPLQNEMHTGIFPFNHGYRLPERFNNMRFYSQWESLRLIEDTFTQNDDIFQTKIDELQNEENIDLNYYFNKIAKQHTTVWASFHRTLLLKDTERWLSNHIRQYKWPIELHIYGENGDFSFMGFIDLFQLLYPGVKATRLVVPLQWVDAESMMVNCGCELLLAPNDKVSSFVATVQKASKATNESAPTSRNTEITYIPRPTGSDDNCAFLIVEVALARPFKEPIIPAHISDSEINEMLIQMEVLPSKRECTGRGQLDRDWQATVRGAANSLRRVPYFGMTDLCTINRQLSEARTRVELITSFWQDSAVYVNNNFIVSDFLHSEQTYEEMLLIAHACLMRIANETLLTADNRQDLSPTMRAARHARHLQDLPHAMDLYLQLIVERQREADSWRELATCLKEIDSDWANVCINKSILLNPRHPLSLLSKACSVFEEDPDAAEPFFSALLAFYPFYSTLWIVANAYYLHRELFHMANAIMDQVRKTKAEGLSEEMHFPRAWEHELGDWWDNTPLLPGTSLYYDAADLLLRVRAIALAEVCLSRGLTETGESAVYYHMVALCCRLRGDTEDALCHLKQGIEKFGEISYLRSLEGECYHKRRDVSSSVSSFAKTGSYTSPYITLLSLPRRDSIRTRSILTDLTRRHPSAYAWMAFADVWMMQSAIGDGGDAGTSEEQRVAADNAATCALHALKYDRRAGRAWSLLAILLEPNARRQFCKEMAIMCGGNKLLEKHSKYTVDPKQSICFRLGIALRECCCNMCEYLKF